MREERIRKFEESVPSIRHYFLNNANKSEKAKYFQEYFGIKALPESKDENTQRIEFFWEDRNIDIGTDGKEIKENGARLLINCSYYGYATIQLFPCYTETQKHKENSVILFHRINPKWLDCSFFNFLLWQTFVSYSKVTAIDGGSSIMSRFYIRLIRYLCTKNVGGIIEGTRLWHDIKIFIGIVFAVISSSLFVYFLPSKEKEEKERLEGNISILMNRIDSLKKEMKVEEDISSKLDSLIYYQKVIEKNTKQLKKGK